MPLVERLRGTLRRIAGDFVSLSNELEISSADNGRDGGGIVFIAPNYRWGQRSSEQTARQLAILRAYSTLAELLKVLLAGAPEQIEYQRQELDKQMREWLEFASNWSLSLSKPQNEGCIRATCQGIEALIDVLASGTAKGLIVIPDTNALLGHPDPVSYREHTGMDSFVFLVLPTVLAELDKLKTEHRNDVVREKAKDAIRRSKGWRNQGSLSEGVAVDKTISVRAEHREPDMVNTLSWLDPQNADDRIVASVLAVQATYPGVRVVLATGDINLQNKADAAMIETIDI